MIVAFGPLLTAQTPQVTPPDNWQRPATPNGAHNPNGAAYPNGPSYPNSPNYPNGPGYPNRAMYPNNPMYQRQRGFPSQPIGVPSATAPVSPVQNAVAPAAASAATSIQSPSLLQEPAQKAVVRLGGDGLYIKAENSSLSQILRDISIATGTKVSGQAGEERIFGTYGPADANEVMSALLYGSDYNVLMVGSTGSGAPRELVLTRRSTASAGGASPAPPVRNEDDTEGGTPYEETQQPPQPPTSFPPGMARAPMPPLQNLYPNGSQEPAPTPQQLLEQLQQMHQQSGQPVVTDPPQHRE